MLQWEHSAILLTCIKLPFVIKIIVLSILEWPFYTGFTVIFKYFKYKAKIWPWLVSALKAGCSVVVN